MALSDKKVTEAVLGTGVSSAPDRLVGTAAENKAVFDRLIRAVVAGSLNPLIDELVGSGGAAGIGADFAGAQPPTVAGALQALQGLVDDRYNKKESQALVEKETAALLKAAKLDDDGVWTFTARDGSTFRVDSKKGNLELFQAAAKQAMEAAAKAKLEADRATQIAGGDFATHAEVAVKAGKPLKVTPGNLAALDGEGNLSDAGVRADVFATKEAVQACALLSEKVQAVLAADAWQGERRPYRQEVLMEKTERTGFVCLAPTESRDVWDVCRRAGLRLVAQSDTGLVFAADGDKPTLDLPIVIFLVG